MRRPSVFHRDQGGLEIKMTPMIDVVFLLLIFFGNTFWKWNSPGFRTSLFSKTYKAIFHSSIVVIIPRLKEKIMSKN